MYFARCNLLWICWCQLSCQRFKIYFIIKGLKSVKGIEQLTGEGSGDRCRPSAGTRQSPGRVPGGSEVLAFYKQYIIKGKNWSKCKKICISCLMQYLDLQTLKCVIYWMSLFDGNIMLSNSILRGCIDVQIKYPQGVFLGGGGRLRGGCTSTQSTPWLRPCIRSSNVLQYLTLTWTTSYFDILYCK
jgi:hypothetical protein